MRGFSRAAIGASLLAVLSAPALAQTLRMDFPVTNGPVYATALSGTTLYIGGTFTEVRPASGGAGVPRNGLAALDVTTGGIKSWDPHPNWPGILALAVSGPTVFAGGSFTSIDGQPREYVAALDGVTGEVGTWNAGSVYDIHDAGVYALAATDTTVYVGGAFYYIGGQYRDGLAALDATTGQATAWNPQAFAEVNALVVVGSTVYVGGEFSTMGGKTRNHIAALDVMTGAATSWSPTANYRVMDLGVSGNTVYAAGLFSMIGGALRNRVAALLATSGQAKGWNPDADSWVWSLAVADAAVYVGGNFTNVGGQPRNHIAALDRASGLAMPWDPNANGDVWALSVDGANVYAGGEFTQVQGLARGYIAAWELDVTDVSGEYQTGVRLACEPNPFRASARIRYRLTEPSVVRLDVFDVSGRLVLPLVDERTAPAGWHEAPLDGRRIQDGIYFCRLKVGSDARVLRVLRID